MKKLFLLLIMSISATTFAQDQPAKTEQETPKKIYKSKTNQGKNELKLNAFYLIVGAFEMSYERILTDESSAGVSVGGSFDEDGLDYNYSIEPFYRYFFGRKPAAGFFVEGFGSINSRDYETYNFNQNNFTSSVKVYEKTHLGLGIGVGGKFITRNNIVFEISGGIGRNLTAGSSNGESYNGYNEKIIGRGGISIGYRF